MKILFWNVCKATDPQKRQRINNVILSIHPNLVGIQESKIRDIDPTIIGQIFRSQDVAFVFSPSIESLRGILCC